MLVISFIGLVLYFAVDGKGIGIAYKYIIAAWSGCLGVLFGVPGIVCSKDKTVKLIAIGCTAVASLLILLAIASVLNLKAEMENDRYPISMHSKSYDRTYEEPVVHPITRAWSTQERERAKDVAKKIQDATKAIEKPEYEAPKAKDAIDENAIRDLSAR